MPPYEYDPRRTNYNTNGSPKPPTKQELFAAYVENAARCGSLACYYARRTAASDECVVPSAAPEELPNWAIDGIVSNEARHLDEELKQL